MRSLLAIFLVIAYILAMFGIIALAIFAVDTVLDLLRRHGGRFIWREGFMSNESPGDFGYGLFWEQPAEHPNPRRYYGKICTKHPSLQGERRRLDGECIGCHDQMPCEET